ncbi:hypothetical protein PL9214290803 [Planktothrix tepida PCC 9214]|uniref:Uncharacterized protein n=1 Tax=Planktothrix tepida PCC 9214 TaxID=671072 RepID=A0A1J1LH43_9CYAN|nr:hypothetical protein PL9214290803 [Planktothrix tepida PCC 9214]
MLPFPRPVSKMTIVLLEEGTGNREQGTVRIERVLEFKNVLTVMRSAIYLSSGANICIVERGLPPQRKTSA